MELNNETRQGELIRAFRETLQKLSGQIECSKCNLCEKGAVYVLGFEIPVVRKLGIPLRDIDGSYFFEMETEYCPAYDSVNKRCTIYAERPICCRLFPLDIFVENDKLKWIVFDDCPIVKHKMREDLFSFVMEIAKDFERLMTKDICDEFKREYEAWKKTDDPFLTVGRYTIIKDVEIK